VVQTGPQRTSLDHVKQQRTASNHEVHAAQVHLGAGWTYPGWQVYVVGWRQIWPISQASQARTSHHGVDR
jgi:hypothetical protein